MCCSLSTATLVFSESMRLRPVQPLCVCTPAWEPPVSVQGCADRVGDSAALLGAIGVSGRGSRA
jgi:hypothetical protein